MDVKIYNLFCLLSVIGSTNAAGPAFITEWDYDLSSSKGPNNWGNTWADCKLDRQSPIDISSSAAVDSTLKPLFLGGYSNTPQEDVVYRMENVGSTLKISIGRKGGQESPIHLGHNGYTWRLVQLHFHWGNTSDVGSEHTLDGKQYPAEVHLVHYNTKYLTINDAISEPDGLLVWGHFLEVSSADNSGMERLTSKIKDILSGGQSVNLDLFPLSGLVPNDSEDKYYTYPGSLTTPTCNPSVTWVVNQNTIKLSENQLSQFRKMHIFNTSSSKIINNYRPVLPLKGRTVKKCCEKVKIPECKNATSNKTGAGVSVVGGLISFIIPLISIVVNRL